MKLAGIYRKRGKLATAEALKANALDILRHQLVKEHSDVLGNMASLASTYHGRGRYGEAKELETHVLENFTRVLGENTCRYWLLWRVLCKIISARVVGMKLSD